jgi:hypothetical protein
MIGMDLSSGGFALESEFVLDIPDADVMLMLRMTDPSANPDR